MSLLSRKLLSTFNGTARLMVSPRRAWFPSPSGTEIQTSPMAGETDHGERHVAAMGLASLTTLDTRLLLSPADLALLSASPPIPGGRLYYSFTGTRATAQRYQITGTRTLPDLAGWIEIRATLSK